MEALEQIDLVKVFPGFGLPSHLMHVVSYVVALYGNRMAFEGALDLRYCLSCVEQGGRLPGVSKALQGHRASVHLTSSAHGRRRID
jgi:hypothetical protein